MFVVFIQEDIGFLQMHYFIMVWTSCIFYLQMYEGKLMRKVWLDIEYMEKDERDGGKFNKCAVNIYLFKFNNKNSTKRCEICSKLKIKTNLVSSASFSYNKSKANKRYFFKIALGARLNKNTRTTSEASL